MLINFFRWCSNLEIINQYRENLESDIFYVINKLSQDYDTIMNIPIKRFYKFIENKIKYDSEKQTELAFILEKFKGLTG